MHSSTSRPRDVSPPAADGDTPQGVSWRPLVPPPTVIQVVVLKRLLAVPEQLAQRHAQRAAGDLPRHELLQKEI